jgi:hypothetical protein
MNPTLTSLLYDQCALDQRENTSIYQYNLIMDTSVSEPKKKCYQSQTPFVENPFKSIPSQYIDIESELSGLTRLNSKCAVKKYHMDTTEQKKMFYETCQGQNDLKMEYTRMKRSHNIKENDSDNERISKNNFYPRDSEDKISDFEKQRMENTQQIHYNYTKFDQNTRQTLKQFIQEKKQNVKWLY